MSNWQQVQDEHGNVWMYDHDTGEYRDQEDIHTDLANSAINAALEHEAAQYGIDPEDFRQRLSAAGGIVNAALEGVYAQEIVQALEEQEIQEHRPAAHGRDSNVGAAVKDMMGMLGHARAGDAGQ